MTETEVDYRTGEIRSGGLREHGTDEALGKLYLALGKAQAAFSPITRSKTVRISGEKAGYSFDYAPLEDLIEATRKSLTDNGLVVLTPIYRQEGEAQVLVIVAHEGGARIVVPFGFTPDGDIKGLGAHITYLRRYGYAAMLNLTADTDAEDNPSTPEPRPAARSTRQTEAPRLAQAASQSNSQAVQDTAEFIAQQMPAQSEPSNDDVAPPLCKCGMAREHREFTSKQGKQINGWFCANKDGQGNSVCKPLDFVTREEWK